MGHTAGAMRASWWCSAFLLAAVITVSAADWSCVTQSDSVQEAWQPCPLQDEDKAGGPTPSDHSASPNVKSSDQSGLGEANRLGTGSGEAAQGVKPIVGISCLTIDGKKVDCSNRELRDQTIKYTIKQQPSNQAAIKRGTGRSRKRARQPSKRKRRAGHSKSKQSARRQRKRRNASRRKSSRKIKSYPL